MRKWVVGVGVLFVVGCSGLRDAFTAHVDEVARAGDEELSVSQLSDILSSGKSLPLRRDVVERVAGLWVEYALFAQRIAAGDSLLDSASVVNALWPDVQQRIADHFHEKVIGQATTLDSAQVDSAYAAGNHRLIDHILVRTSPEMAPNIKTSKRRQAEAILAALKHGASWSKENEQNEDPSARPNGGRLGVIGRGEMVAPFENVAFALKPGEVSDVTETPFGFHVLRRPPLSEVRADFRAGVEDRLVARMDSTYLTDLEKRWDIEVRPGAAAAVRAAATDPLRAERSNAVLATYKGGKFRVRDFMPWFYSMPLEQQGQVASVTDDKRVDEYVRTLVRNQVLLLEADAQGVHLTTKDMTELREELRDKLGVLANQLRVDTASLGDSVPTPAARSKLVAERVISYLNDIANNRRRFIVVPQLLSSRLRADAHWEVVPAGVDRALERAQGMRGAADSAAARAAGVPSALPQGSSEPAEVTPLPIKPNPGDSGRRGAAPARHD